MQTAVRPSLRPRLAAIAPTAADAVKSAGGWLFDQALAGWDVTVITAEQADHRSLRILGVREHTLEAALAYRADGACVRAIALSAALFDSDERVRHMVLGAVETGLPELRLWGEGGLPAELAGRAEAVSHRLSAAARAFKAQALAAAAIEKDGLTGTEEFRRGEFRHLSLAAAR
ncbi:MAG TPA: hypothetical protein VMU95_14435 [Trebonia sp.]|nr:hypothetical protein [Trebonia sp.]